LLHYTNDEIASRYREVFEQAIARRAGLGVPQQLPALDAASGPAARR